MHANSQTDAEAIFSGEIGAMAGLGKLTTGDTICAEQAQIALDRIEFPEPVMFMAIEPKSRADKEKLEEALQLLQQGQVQLPAGLAPRAASWNTGSTPPAPPVPRAAAGK